MADPSLYSQYILGASNLEAMDTTPITRDEVLSKLELNLIKAQTEEEECKCLQKGCQIHRRRLGICYAPTLQTNIYG